MFVHEYIIYSNLLLEEGRSGRWTERQASRVDTRERGKKKERE